LRRQADQRNSRDRKTKFEETSFGRGENDAGRMEAAFPHLPDAKMSGFF
jgi:hypothetical protein